MMDAEQLRLTPEEAMKVKLPILPWRRAKRIKELAQPLGGLSTGVGSLSEIYEVPTRGRLVRKAVQVRNENGVKAFAGELGIEDPSLAESLYCIGRLTGDVNPDGSLTEREQQIVLSAESVSALLEYRQSLGNTSNI